MVFFTCNGCGESLKKNKVDRHANSCRGCEYLTCIDCSKDFWGNEYAKHTTCITEDQKYAATGFVAKPNKGEVKQQEWIKKVTNAVADSNTSGEVQTILEQLVNYGNIPRKKAKFLNFLKNSLKIRDAKVSEQVWNVFSAANNKGSDTNKPVGADLNEAKPDSQNKEMSPNKDNVSKKTKKRKCSETLEKNNKNSKKLKEMVENTEVIENGKSENNSIDNTARSKFPWNRAIRKCLKAEDGNELGIKKLKKKVLREYEAFIEVCKSKRLTENEQSALFIKKIEKNPKLVVRKNKVKIL